MKKRVSIYILLLLGTGLSARHIDDDPLLLDSLLKAHQNMHFYRSPTLGRADSVWHRESRFYLYFDTDSICRQFIRKGGYNAIPDEMDYLYFAVFTEMLPEQRAIEIAKMEKVAVEYNAEALMREVEWQHISKLPDDSDEEFEYRINALRELLHKAEVRRDTLMQIRIKEDIHSSFRYRYRLPEAMEEAVDILQLLDKITDEQFAGRRQLYYFIGELFYQYGYNAQAIPLMEKAMKDADYFFDRANLRARNSLGLYYRNEEKMELSDAYFRSMLESRDMVKYRREYDAIAISNLGKNCLLRKDFKKAEMLLLKALPVMLDFGDYTFSAGICMALGECYLADKKIPQAKTMIDSARMYIEISSAYDLNITFYPLLSNYYAAIGDMETSRACMDSTVRQNQLYRRQYNPSHILQAEKKHYDAEKQLQEKQLEAETFARKRNRNYFLFALGSSILLSLALVIWFYYNRIIVRKNRGLYQQIKEQDKLLEELKQMALSYGELTQSTPQTAHSAEKHDTASLQNREMQQQRQLVFQLREYLLCDKNFAKHEIDRNELITALATNKTYLFEAIKVVTGKTPQEYINVMRLEEARRLLDHHSELTVEAIATESGFNTSRTFYRLFRKQYRMSPAEYRNAAENQQPD